MSAHAAWVRAIALVLSTLVGEVQAEKASPFPNDFHIANFTPVATDPTGLAADLEETASLTILARVGRQRIVDAGCEIQRDTTIFVGARKTGTSDAGLLAVDLWRRLSGAGPARAVATPMGKDQARHQHSRAGPAGCPKQSPPRRSAWLIRGLFIALGL